MSIKRSRKNDERSRPMKTREHVKSAMKRKLNESTLTMTDAKRLHMQPYTGDQVASKLKRLKVIRPGIYIPYFDLQGNETGFFRFRYLEYGTERGFGALVRNRLKPLRYVQYPDTLNELYLPPLTSWSSIAADPGCPDSDYGR